MLEAGRHPDLALKPLGAHRGGELRVQNLERHRPVVPEVVRQVNGGHAPTPQLALDPIPVGECGLERGAEIGHGPYFSIGLNENFCPPTDASYMSPPFAIVTIATPFR